MNDKEIVERAQSAFDVVVLQANLAVSMSQGLSSWERLRKPFWIDPIAYAYAAATVYLKSDQVVKRGESATELRFKRTFAKLAESYGDPFTRVIERDRELQPDDFDPAADLDVIRRTLGWQRSALAPPAPDAKYLPEGDLEPILLTVPYFPLQPYPRTVSRPKWLDVNMRLIQAALTADIVPPERLAVGVLVEESLFDSNEFEPIWRAYLDLDVRHLWLWISDNDEITEMTSTRAKRLRKFVLDGVSAGKSIHQSFGGSFSSFLLHDGLQSVAHGVGYWEHKNWEPLAPGGMPSLRFFFPPLRRRLAFLEADRSIPATVATEEDFFREICGCAQCRITLENGLASFAEYGQVERRTRVDRWGNRIDYDVPVPRALALSKLHYLHAKADEVALVTAAAFDPPATLRSAIGTYQGGPVPVTPLENWLAAWDDE